MRLKKIASLVGGALTGDGEVEITGVASIEEAETGELVFAENAKYLSVALRSRASAILAPADTPEAEAASTPLLLVESPRAAFVQVLEAFVQPLDAPPGIHPSAQIGRNVHLGAGAHIGPNVSIGEGVTLGERVILFANVCIGAGCVIGAETILHPNVTLYPRVTVGRRCILHAGSVLGADGFGYIPVGRSLRKVPQLGTVEIGDDVEIGANTCIDRAKTGTTVIGSGTKIDNLVHIGHNVRVGQSCLIIAQAGVAGSVTIGNGVVLAGQAGLKDHITLGDGARVAAQGGVIGDVPAGVTVSGYPARPHAEKMREYAAMARLPETLKRLRELEKRLAALEALHEPRNKSWSEGEG